MRIKVNVIIATLGAVTFLYAILFHYRAPYFDHWDLAPLLESWDARTLTPARLFEIHGGHWHAGAYAVLVPLAALTGWSHLAEAIACFSLMTASAWLALLLARRFSLASGAPLPVLLIATAFVAFSLDQASNLLWGFQVAVFMNVAGLGLTIWALTGRSLSAAMLLVSLCGLALAVFSYATGFALMPIGLALLMVRREPLARRAFFAAIWGAICLAMCLAFIAAQRDAPMGGSFDSADLRQPDFLLYLVMFVLNFIGAGVSRFASDLVVPIAIITFGATGAAAFMLRQRGVVGLAAPLSLCAYGIGAALLCGLGRYDFGADQGASSRYISSSTPFWLGALWLLLAAWARVEARELRNTLAGFLLFLALLKAGNSVQSAAKHIALSHEIAAIADTMRADPAAAAATARRISFDRQDIARHVAFLREKRWSMFVTRAPQSPPPPSPLD